MSLYSIITDSYVSTFFSSILIGRDVLSSAVCVLNLCCRPNSFVIITANRVIHCNTDLPEEMHHWISLLQKPKGDPKVEGQEFLVRGQFRPQTRCWNHKDAKETLFFIFLP